MTEKKRRMEEGTAAKAAAQFRVRRIRPTETKPGEPVTPEEYQAVVQRLESERSELLLANQELARIGERREAEIKTLKDRVRLLEAGCRNGIRMVEEARSILASAAIIIHPIPDDFTEAQPVRIDETMAAALDKATGETRPV